MCLQSWATGGIIMMARQLKVTCHVQSGRCKICVLLVLSVALLHRNSAHPLPPQAGPALPRQLCELVFALGAWLHACRAAAFSGGLSLTRLSMREDRLEIPALGTQNVILELSIRLLREHFSEPRPIRGTRHPYGSADPALVQTLSASGRSAAQCCVMGTREPQAIESA